MRINLTAIKSRRIEHYCHSRASCTYIKPCPLNTRDWVLGCRYASDARRPKMGQLFNSNFGGKQNGTDPLTDYVRLWSSHIHYLSASTATLILLVWDRAFFFPSLFFLSLICRSTANKPQWHHFAWDKNVIVKTDMIRIEVLATLMSLFSL